MAYATANDARRYCKKLTIANMPDNQLEEYIQAVTDRDINPILKQHYDVTTLEVTSSRLVKEATAMGAGLDAMKTEYGSSRRSDLKSDIEKTQEDYDMLLLHLRLGIQRI